MRVTQAPTLCAMAGAAVALLAGRSSARVGSGFGVATPIGDGWRRRRRHPRRYVRIGEPRAAGAAAQGDHRYGTAALLERYSPTQLALRICGAGLAAVLLGPLAALAVVGVVVALPAVRLHRSNRARRLAIEASVPDVVDLLALAVASGATVRWAIEVVVRFGPGPLVDELGQVLTDTVRGRSLAEALEAMAERVGPSLDPLVSALTSTERFGVPLGPQLRRLAEQERALARRRTEERARRLPVTMLVPLVSCVLPAFVLLTVVPMVATVGSDQLHEFAPRGGSLSPGPLPPSNDLPPCPGGEETPC